MPKQAPFDVDGNMQAYPGHAWLGGRYVESALQPVEPFIANMLVVGMETGRSAKRLVVKDLRTGKTYPMFVADIVNLLKDIPIHGTWEVSKRGQNYGVKKSS